ncbi:MAG: hypothetical protein IJR02_09605 [Bacteroidaceae bacterium]|nr:hypothetical protein [Bacteroidaceae bacterium]
MIIIEKKTKKVKVRGTGTYDLETKRFGFEPFNEAPSTQQNVKTCAGGGKRWTTTGSDPSRMMTLKCKESSPDQYSDLAAQFNALTKDLKPKKPLTLPDSLRVVKEQGLECWLDEEKNEITFTGTIDLSRHHRDWQAEVLRQVQLVVRRLPASDKFNRVINNIKNGGTK